MAISNYGPYDVQTFKSAVDMAGTVGRFASISGANEVNLHASLITVADGVIVSVEGAGAGVDIGVMTTSGRKVPVVASAAITAGDNLSSLAANGKALTAATSSVIQGRALDAASAEDNLVTCLFGYKGVEV